MTQIEEQTASLAMSPPELMLWHGMGACVHRSRLADLANAIDREQSPRDRADQRRDRELNRRADIAAAWNAAEMPVRKHRKRGPARQNWQSMGVRVGNTLYPSKRLAMATGGMTWKRLHEMLASGEAAMIANPSQGAENGATNGSERLTATGSAA